MWILIFSMIITFFVQDWFRWGGRIAFLVLPAVSIHGLPRRFFKGRRKTKKSPLSASFRFRGKRIHGRKQIKSADIIFWPQQIRRWLLRNNIVEGVFLPAIDTWSTKRMLWSVPSMEKAEGLPRFLCRFHWGRGSACESYLPSSSNGGRGISCAGSTGSNGSRNLLFYKYNRWRARSKCFCKS